MKNKSKSPLLSDEELGEKLKQCIALIDDIFDGECLRTALFVYQLDEQNEEIYTSAISSLDFQQLRYLLREFMGDEDSITDQTVDTNKRLLN